MTSSSSNTMAKIRRTTTANNHRMTEFFTQQPRTSSQPPSSSPSSSSISRLARKAPSDLRKMTLMQTQPSAQSQSKMDARPQRPQSRAVKKENAPPPPLSRTRTDREVICISSSSEAHTLISVSSNSVVSVDSSIVEVVPPVKQDRRLLQTFDIASSSPLPPPRRRSPRLLNSKAPPRRETGRNVASQPRKHAPRKRKKPEGVQSDDGDVIELDAMEEVIYVSSKPARIDLGTPAPSPPVKSRPSSRKRARLDADPYMDASSDVEEVIPSSQSDERELSILKKSRKNLKEVTESVREWRLSSSQSNAPPESSDTLGDSFDDSGMDFDFDHPVSSPDSPGVRDRSKTPISTSHAIYSSSQSTPRRNSQLQTPAKPSLPQKVPPSAIPEPIQVPSGSKPPSPQVVSSASSLTKVDTPSRTLPSNKKLITPRSTSSRRLVINNIESPCMHWPRTEASNVEADMETEIALMDQNEKTDAIVERIKAEARAKAMALPDEDSMILGPLNDSDSELDSPTNLFSQLVKGKGRGKTIRKLRTSTTTDNAASDDGNESLLTDTDELNRRLSRRKSGRRQAQRSSSPISLSSNVVRTRRAPNMLPSVFSSAARIPPKKKPINPLSKLLKEKAREERFAEIRRNPGLDSDLDLSDTAEDRSTEGLPGSATKLRRQNSDEGDIENIVGEADRVRLFGKEDNSVLGKILESDRQEKGKGKAVAEVLGVPFWEVPSEEAMEVDPCVFGLPRLENAGRDASIELLKEFVDAKDVDGATVLLQASMFDIGDVGFMEWLFETAICSTGTLASTAHTVLGHVCDSSSSYEQVLAVPISPVLRALSKFGARRDILEILGMDVLPRDGPTCSEVQRSEALWRLSELVRAFGVARMLDGEDVPSCFALLLAIGMDVKTDINLRLSIKRTLNALIITYCGEFSEERGEMEMDICSKVLPLITDMSPANKEYLLSYIDGDSLVARRIGQWLAFAMLTGDYGSRLAKEFIDGPPALSDIIALLDPHSGNGLQSELFNIRRGSEQTDSFDYAALGHHVEVLGHVLMNISQYVVLENLAAREAHSIGNFSSKGGDESPSKRRSDKSSKLETIKALLERLGNNIADTRAAHLDRSQAKAVIQQLAMRVDYQRNSANGRAKIYSYFGGKSA